MEVIAHIFLIAMPIFMVLVLGEKLYGYLKGNDTVPIMDAISSAYSGLTLIIRMLLGYGITIVSYGFLYKHLALFHLNATWVAYVVTFIVIDFQGYWAHRLIHKINFLWNRHLIYHSSEEFNLACALRQSISDITKVLFFLSIPAAILGLDPQIVAVVIPIHGFAQYWYHTRWIGKLGFLEYIIVTPSQHRVHHAFNPIYLDKNFSGIFCIWDRMFGTYQEELDTEPPVYGITRPSRTYNPITINFEHIILLLKDAWRADSWLDKLTIWFRPTGWRPAGFEEKYPVQKITNHYNFEKYRPDAPASLQLWSTVQYLVLFFVVLYVLHNFMQVGAGRLVVFAGFVLVQTFSATELMNRNKTAFWYSLFSTLVCIAMYVSDPTFFGLKNVSDMLPLLFVAYFILQTIIAYLFSAQVQSSSPDVAPATV